MTIQQLSIFVENKEGRLAEVADLLASNGIDLRALSLADTQDFGILRIIVSDAAKAARVLNDANYICSETPVLAVAIPDHPGGMAKVLDILAKAGMSLEYTYAFITRHTDCAYMICRLADNEKAIAALQAAGIDLASQSDIAQL